jgi:hypothetical protein
MKPFVRNDLQLTDHILRFRSVGPGFLASPTLTPRNPVLAMEEEGPLSLALRTFGLFFLKGRMPRASLARFLH